MKSSKSTALRAEIRHTIDFTVFWDYPVNICRFPIFTVEEKPVEWQHWRYIDRKEKMRSKSLQSNLIIPSSPSTHASFWSRRPFSRWQTCRADGCWPPKYYSQASSEIIFRMEKCEKLQYRLSLPRISSS